jgi:hypothetical protein
VSTSKEKKQNTHKENTKKQGNLNHLNDDDNDKEMRKSNIYMSV